MELVLSNVSSLHTSTDLLKIRRQLFDKQEGVDPILDEKIDYKDSVLDHDHSTQHCRAALHRQTNAFEGLVTNAHKRCLGWLTDKSLPDILRSLADYLEKDFSKNPYHSGWIKKCLTEFSKLNAAGQKNVLKKLEVSVEGNAASRKLALKKAIVKGKLEYLPIKKLIADNERSL